MASNIEERDKINKEYLRKEVNNILEPLMIEVVKEKPENQVLSTHFILLQIKFMLKYLETQYNERATLGSREDYEFSK